MSRVQFPPALQRYREIGYCPRCGRAFGADDFHAEECLYLCAGCGFDFYQNPLPAAVVLIPNPRAPDEVLVLKRSTRPGIGLWCVPGGFIRYGEQPAEAARREAHEESGADVEVGSVLRAGLVNYTYRDRQICIVEIAFLARLHDAAAPLVRSSQEAAELRFASLTELLSESTRWAFPEQLEILRVYQKRLAERVSVFP